MPALKWTEEAIRAEAAKYDSKKAFVRGCVGAYNAAIKRFPHMVNELFEGKGNRSWSEKMIRAEAAKYGSKAEFSRGNGSAYNAARIRFPGMVDELFENQYRSWDEAAIRAEAAKYSTKVEFKHGSNGAYIATRTRFPGLIDELFENQNRSWDEEAIRAEAAKYSSKVEFWRGCGNGATKAAVRLGLIDELFENQPKYTDGDAFYIWRVDGQWFNGLPVFKIGITSARMGFERIYQCASANRVRVSEVHLLQTEHAKLIERRFHEALEVVPDLDFTDGKTEFRSCDEETLRGLISFATMLGDRLGEEEELLAA